MHKHFEHTELHEMNEQPQYSRLNNIEIQGVYKSEGENNIFVIKTKRLLVVQFLTSRLVPRIKYFPMSFTKRELRSATCPSVDLKLMEYRIEYSLINT